jgi:hypothetical protein
MTRFWAGYGRRCWTDAFWARHHLAWFEQHMYPKRFIGVLFCATLTGGLTQGGNGMGGAKPRFLVWVGHNSRFWFRIIVYHDVLISRIYTSVGENVRIYMFEHPIGTSRYVILSHV